ncbi:MAG: hypothetical protein WBB48_11045 [Thermodesulfobacteriota bacterium]
MNYKIISIGLIFILLGILSRLAENRFYGGVLDNDFVVQESLFLPLSIILLGIGIIVIVTSILIDLIYAKK